MEYSTPRESKEVVVANVVVHFEMHASEPEKLIDFYSNLLGWKLTNDAPGDHGSATPRCPRDASEEERP